VEDKGAKETEIGKLGTVETSTWSLKGTDSAESLPSLSNKPFWRQWLVEVVFCILSFLSFVGMNEMTLPWIIYGC